MTNKWLLKIIGIVFLFSIITLSLCIIYDKEAVRDEDVLLKARISRGFGAETNEIKVENIHIKEKIDNKLLVLFTDEKGEIGDALFTKNLFRDSYKLDSISSGTGLFITKKIKTNKGKYCVVMGRNYKKNASHMTFDIKDKKYTVNIKGKQYYLEYFEISDIAKGNLDSITPQNFVFYDSAGNDISKTLSED